MFYFKDCGNTKYKELTNLYIQACAGFAKYKYGELKDIADVIWLLLEERTDFALMKLVFKGLNNKNMPDNYALQLKLPKKTIVTEKLSYASA